jgi:hypothetical protein
MNEKRIRDALRQIARKRTAHHTDLWTRIEPQVQPRQRRMMPYLATPLGAALVIILLLTISAGAYAAIQKLSDFDPGIQQAQEDELGSIVGKSQTVDGVTMQVDWVYADAHRAAVFFTVSQEESAYRPMGFPVLDMKLRTADGTLLPVIFGGGGGGSGGGGGGGENGTITPAPYVMWTFSGSMNFDTSSIVGTPTDLALHMDLHLSAEMVPVLGGPSEMVDIGPFNFDFSVPFIPAVTFEPKTSETVGDITLTLERVSVTPSSTKTTLCTTGTDHDWLPEARLDTGDQALSDLGFIGIPPQTSRNGTTACATLDFLAPYRGEPVSWILIVDRLQEAISNGTTINGPWRYEVDVP